MSSPSRLPRGLVAVLAGYLLVAGLFAVSVPLWESPDAIWHYEFAAHLARGGGLPTRADEGLQAPWRQEGSQPPLYYLLVAPLIAAVGPTDQAAVIAFNPHAAVGLAGPGGNVNRMVHHERERSLPWRGTVLAARLVGLAGVLLGLLAVLATWAAAAELFPARPAVAIAAAGILAFNPQFLFLAGSITNDVAMAAAGAAVLWRSAAVLARGPTARNAAWLGLACGLALLTKLSALFLMPLAVGALLAAAWQARRPMTRPLLAFAFPAALVGGWWYLRNLVLFGDPTGLPLMLGVMQRRPLPPSPSQLLVELGAIWRSYWAVFGWFNIPAPAWLYRLFDLVTVLGLGAVVWLAARGRLAKPERRGVALAAAAVALVLAGVVAWARLQYPQGRLLFTAAPALSLLLAAGWTAGWSAPAGARAAAAMSGGFAVLALGLLARVILPSYGLAAPRVGHGPIFAAQAAGSAPLDTSARAWMGDMPRRSAAFGGILALEGIGQPRRLARPGEAITFDLAWRALARPERDYSVILHLVDERGLIVAQRDSFPRSGLAPTSDWAPEAQGGPARHLDPQVLEIPALAPAPCACRLHVGLYDPASGERLILPDGRDHLEIGPVRVASARDAQGIANPLAVPFGDAIDLAGLTLDRRAAVAGETLDVALFWKARRRPAVDYKVALQLRREGETWAQRDEQPANGARSTSEWRPGELVEDRHPLAIRPDAPPGAYTLYLKLYDRESERPLPVNGRDFELPLGPVMVLPGEGPPGS